MLEAALIVNVTADVPPEAGMLPVPVHPIQAYWVPIAPAIGEATNSVMLDPLLNQPLDGETEP
jgi:hypothetical protein